jgi:heptosyltransferase-1
MTYQQRYGVPRDLHAIERVRQLFAQTLNYPYLPSQPQYGLHPPIPPRDSDRRYLVFLHGTTWETKHWPEVYWQELADLAGTAGYEVHLPWGSDHERGRAERIAASRPAVRVLPRLTLSEMAAELARASAVVGVDTGLCHLAAALEIPGVTLYGASRPDLTGTRGPAQRALSADFPCAPCLERRCAYTGPTPVVPACYASLPPGRVWNELAALLAEAGR